MGTTGSLCSLNVSDMVSHSQRWLEDVVDDNGENMNSYEQQQREEAKTFHIMIRRNSVSILFFTHFVLSFILSWTTNRRAHIWRLGDVSMVASIVFFTLRRPRQRFFDESLLINLSKAFIAAAFFW